jgi:hypothetical protein
MEGGTRLSAGEGVWPIKASGRLRAVSTRPFTCHSLLSISSKLGYSATPDPYKPVASMHIPGPPAFSAHHVSRHEWHALTCPTTRLASSLVSGSWIAGCGLLFCVTAIYAHPLSCHRTCCLFWKRAVRRLQRCAAEGAAIDYGLTGVIYGFLLTVIVSLATT